MFEIQNISKTFQVDFWSKRFAALDSVSFKVRPGEIVGFLGANGAGKTTLLKIIMGFIKSDAGSVQFDPSLGKNQREIFSNLGYLPERPYFYPHLSGRDFLSYMGQLNNVVGAELAQQINKWAKVFSVDHALDRKVRGYSKGMLQRLGFASALLHDPKIIILDEPLSGLDPRGRKELKDVLKSLHAQGKTIFFSSHIVSDVEEICQSVVVLEGGKLLFEGSISNIIQEHIKPNYLLTTDYQGSVDLAFSSEKLPDGQTVMEVTPENKEKLINEIIKCGGSISGLSYLKPTLEEIVYNIRS
ncbi:MAG: ABC transporter ATP-binding protein [Halobacteriovoraceae bacterium]|jgi:ABC-2 type transport system ATP-binding protein|nr:ABC transporter ATP-binding protein [Halobacteriovoraceae bacterium]MBT5093503.1 ABC transporter ATP-binding protein [Halobacteriovoraceae bacterium]